MADLVMSIREYGNGESLSKSSSEADRLEMKYSDKIEQHLHTMKVKCIELSEQHERKSKYYKFIFNLLSIPVIVLGLVTASLNQEIDNRMTITILVLICSIINALALNINAGQRSELYQTYSGLYEKLASELHSELVKNTKFRLPADVLLSNTTIRINNLRASEPQL